MKKVLCILLSIILLASTLSIFVGCGDDEGDVKPVRPPVTGELYVKKVDNLSPDFIMGMDASSVISLENSGVKYYDFEGNEQDVFVTLWENGINYIRVRIWNNPFDAEGNGFGGGNCDIDTAVEIGKRATAAGMKLLVNFHYSDFWADPAKQMVPRAWKNMEIDDKVVALYDYTKECLNKLKEAKVDVGMVQVGNETNGAMCGERIWMNIYKLMDAGSRATREVFPEALVAVHFANPEKVSNYRDYAKKLNYYDLDYDVFASSYYPFWHGTLDNLSTLLSEIATKYNKKVMVAETAYAYTVNDTDFYGNTVSGDGSVVKNYPFTVQGQSNCIRDVIETVANTTNGIGVFYWEGTWISVGQSTFEANELLWEQYGSGWATSYAGVYDPDDAGKYSGGCACDNQAMFDENGRPLESLKVFALVYEGNTVEITPDAIEDVNLICDLNGEIVLPTTVNAVMSDDSKQELSVVWQNVDYDAMRAGGAQKYDIVGVANNMEAHCYVSMVEYNFLQNYSFETGDNSGWTATAIGTMDEFFVENKPTDSLTGTHNYHFWSGEPNTVEFTLEQSISDLPTGTYKYTISIMGGDSGDTDIYSYVKINGVITYQTPLTITTYNSWDTQVIENIQYTAGDEITVGIYVQCDGSGNGAWGKIDDALFNSVSGDE